MDEYLSLGHMQLVPEDDSSYENAPNKPIFFLPYHAVFKESSTTIKTRAVFDASAKSTTGVSLNDMLMVGPKIQQDHIHCTEIPNAYVRNGCCYIQNVPTNSSASRRLRSTSYTVEKIQ